jgi:uncharacterized protein (DUF2384 family)
MAHPAPTPDAVLGAALLAAAERLGLRGRELAAVIGTSEASISRLRFSRRLDPECKEGELALLLVRVYRSQDALVGTDAAQRKAWLESPNRALNGRPIDLLQRTDGLVHVVAYLDAMRAPA